MCVKENRSEDLSRSPVRSILLCKLGGCWGCVDEKKADLAGQVTLGDGGGEGQVSGRWFLLLKN